MFRAGFFTAQNVPEDYASNQPDQEEVFSKLYSHRLHVSQRFAGSVVDGVPILRFVGCWIKALVDSDGVADWGASKTYRVSCTLNLNNVSQVSFLAETPDASDRFSGSGVFDGSILYWDYSGVAPLRTGSIAFTQYDASTLIAVTGSTTSQKDAVTTATSSFWNCDTLVAEVSSGATLSNVQVFGDVSAGDVYNSQAAYGGVSIGDQVYLYKGYTAAKTALWMRPVKCSTGVSCAFDTAVGLFSQSYDVDAARTVALADGAPVQVENDAMVVPCGSSVVDNNVRINLLEQPNAIFSVSVRPTSLLVPEAICFCVFKLIGADSPRTVCMELRRKPSDESVAQGRVLYGSTTILDYFDVGAVTDAYIVNAYLAYSAVSKSSYLSLEVINSDSGLTFCKYCKAQLPIAIVSSFVCAETVFVEPLARAGARVASSVCSDLFFIMSDYLQSSRIVAVELDYSPSRFATRNDLLTGTWTPTLAPSGETVYDARFTLTFNKEDGQTTPILVTCEYYTSRTDGVAEGKPYSYAFSGYVCTVSTELISTSVESGATTQTYRYSFAPPFDASLELGSSKSYYIKVIVRNAAGETVIANEPSFGPISVTYSGAFECPRASELGLLPSGDTYWMDTFQRSVRVTQSVTQAYWVLYLDGASSDGVASQLQNWVETDPQTGDSLVTLRAPPVSDARLFRIKPDVVHRMDVTLSAGDVYVSCTTGLSVLTYLRGAVPSIGSQLISVALPRDTVVQNVLGVLIYVSNAATATLAETLVTVPVVTVSQRIQVCLPAFQMEAVPFVVRDDSDMRATRYFYQNDWLPHQYVYLTEIALQPYYTGYFEANENDLEKIRSELLVTGRYTRMPCPVDVLGLYYREKSDASVPLTALLVWREEYCVGSSCLATQYLDTSHAFTRTAPVFVYPLSEYVANTRYRVVEGEIVSYNLFTLESLPTSNMSVQMDEVSSWVNNDALHCLKLDYVSNTPLTATYGLYDTTTSTTPLATGSATWLRQGLGYVFSLSAPLYGAGVAPYNDMSLELCVSITLLGVVSPLVYKTTSYFSYTRVIAFTGPTGEGTSYSVTAQCTSAPENISYKMYNAESGVYVGYGTIEVTGFTPPYTYVLTLDPPVFDKSVTLFKNTMLNIATAYSVSGKFYYVAKAFPFNTVAYSAWVMESNNGIVVEGASSSRWAVGASSAHMMVFYTNLAPDTTVSYALTSGATLATGVGVVSDNVIYFSAPSMGASTANYAFWSMVVTITTGGASLQVRKEYRFTTFALNAWIMNANTVVQTLNPDTSPPATSSTWVNSAVNHRLTVTPSTPVQRASYDVYDGAALVGSGAASVSLSLGASVVSLDAPVLNTSQLPVFNNKTLTVLVSMVNSKGAIVVSFAAGSSELTYVSGGRPSAGAFLSGTGLADGTVVTSVVGSVIGVSAATLSSQSNVSVNVSATFQASGIFSFSLLQWSLNANQVIVNTTWPSLTLSGFSIQASSYQLFDGATQIASGLCDTATTSAGFSTVTLLSPSSVSSSVFTRQARTLTMQVATVNGALVLVKTSLFSYLTFGGYTMELNNVLVKDVTLPTITWSDPSLSLHVISLSAVGSPSGAYVLGDNVGVGTFGSNLYLSAPTVIAPSIVTSVWKVQYALTSTLLLDGVSTATLSQSNTYSIVLATNFNFPSVTVICYTGSAYRWGNTTGGANPTVTLDTPVPISLSSYKLYRGSVVVGVGASSVVGGSTVSLSPPTMSGAVFFEQDLTLNLSIELDSQLVSVRKTLIFTYQSTC